MRIRLGPTTYLIKGQGSIGFTADGITGGTVITSDWDHRSTRPGVIWATNFNSSAEVDNWRWIGGPGWVPNPTPGSNAEKLSWETSDGVSGSGCLQHLQSSTGNNSVAWWRIFDPTQNDATYVGTGTYGAETVAGTLPENPGDTFYVSYALKISQARWDEPNTGGFKISYLSTAAFSLTNQEIVLHSNNQNETVYFYRSGDPPVYHDLGGQIILQPGKDGPIAYYPWDSDSEATAFYGSEEWIHYLFAITKPTAGTLTGTNVKIYRCRTEKGERNWTKIWDFTETASNYSFYPWGAPSDLPAGPDGWNALIFTGYENSRGSGGSDVWIRYDEAILSTQKIPAPNSKAPEWVTRAISNGWSVGQWLDISGSNPTSGYQLTATNTPWQANQAGPQPELEINLATVITSWCGACLGEDYGEYGTYFIGPGSGHGDPARNQVYAFDLNTRTWTEEYPGGTGAIDTTFGHYSNDNSAISMHTYQNLQWAPQKGIWLYKTVDSWGDAGNPGTNNRYPHTFNPFTGNWEVEGSMPNAIWNSDIGDNQWDYTSTAYDPWRRVFWVHGASGYDNNFAKYDIESDTWTSYGVGASQNSGSETAMVVDPVRDVIVHFGFKNPVSGIRYKPLANPGGGWSSVSDSNRPSMTAASSWTFSHALNAIIYLDKGVESGGTGLYKGVWQSGGGYDPQGSPSTRYNPGTYTIAWSRIDNVSQPAGGVIPTNGTNNGTHNRFRIMRWGDTEIGFICNDINGSVSAVRLS